MSNPQYRTLRFTRVVNFNKIVGKFSQASIISFFFKKGLVMFFDSLQSFNRLSSFFKVTHHFHFQKYNDFWFRRMKKKMKERYTGCSGKIVFFTIHFNPFLAYIAVRDLQSSHRNAIVQSLLLTGNFLYNQ